MERYVPLLAVGHPALPHDAEGPVPERGRNPHDGLRHAAPSLRHRPWTRADGGDPRDTAPALITPRGTSPGTARRGRLRSTQDQ
ncbi:hypothetical protein FRZ03_32235 [Streptomyces misionensis]|uniref:Uncharacterized protein n=1 Tax=Streptomyces misionensis TaxID=67331 RepID=A0A5C6IWV5_9ACTN|nr:hypothetical protein [Streptomyces misionensis]TWV32835.1 hypothetical protein FRZ03_32235 [Streptomyces misionensis]